MTTPDPLLRIAEAEHEQALQLLASHENVCPGGCSTCVSYRGHVERTGDQVRLLGQEAEDVPLW
jgi:hypothetical protein